MSEYMKKKKSTLHIFLQDPVCHINGIISTPNDYEFSLTQFWM